MMRRRDDTLRPAGCAPGLVPNDRYAPVTTAPRRTVTQAWPMEEPSSSGYSHAPFENCQPFAPSLALLQQQQQQSELEGHAASWATSSSDLTSHSKSNSSSYHPRRRHYEMQDEELNMRSHKRQEVELDGDRWGDDWMDRSSAVVPLYSDHGSYNYDYDYDTQQQTADQYNVQQTADQYFASAPAPAAVSQRFVHHSATPSQPTAGRLSSSLSSSFATAQRVSAAPTTSAKLGAKTKRSSTSDSNNSSNDSNTAKPTMQTPAKSAKPSETKTAASATKPKKRMRYLRDTDRRNIIKRIDNGEKQAALAREFGVTRAAICHMKKNRFEILSRYDLLVRTAQELELSENFVNPPGVELMVHELRASSVLLLLTTLRDSRTTLRNFRRAASRLIMILLEEALGLVGTAPVDVITDTGSIHHGIERQASICSVGIGEEGAPFLALFRQIEPDLPQGTIGVTMVRDQHGNTTWELESMELPSNIGQFKVLLFKATCDSGAEVSKAVEALCSVGVQQANISLVTITCSTDGLVAICNGSPKVKIISASVDGKVDFQTQTTIPGLGDFVQRYNE